MNGGAWVECGGRLGPLEGSVAAASGCVAGCKASSRGVLRCMQQHSWRAVAGSACAEGVERLVMVVGSEGPSVCWRHPGVEFLSVGHMPSRALTAFFLFQPLDATDYRGHMIDAPAWRGVAWHLYLKHLTCSGMAHGGTGRLLLLSLAYRNSLSALAAADGALHACWLGGPGGLQAKGHCQQHRWS